MAWPEPFVYFGTSDFSVQVLQGLFQAGVKPSLVVTTAPKPAGRGLARLPTPIGVAAKTLGLPVLEVTTFRTPEPLQALQQLHVSLGVLVAFGKIIPPQVLALYSQGIVNVHPSLLPRYRGPAPIQYALMGGQTETGISLILLDSEVDHGPILVQESYPIAADDTALTLGAKLAEGSVQLLLRSLPAYISGQLSPTVQDHTQATFTHVITRLDGQANFNRSAVELDGQRRAFTPWPGLWTTWLGKRLKLTQTSALEGGGQPGLVSHKDHAIIIGCARGLLKVSRLQLEGRAELAAEEFLRGTPSIIGNELT